MIKTAKLTVKAQESGKIGLILITEYDEPFNPSPNQIEL